MDTICEPAQIFTLIAGIDLLLISLFPKEDRPFITRLKIFILAIILIIGWTTVVNYSCIHADNYVAWGLVLLPAMYMLFRWRK
jgi:hypothetical protein